MDAQKIGFFFRIAALIAMLVTAGCAGVTDNKNPDDIITPDTSVTDTGGDTAGDADESVVPDDTTDTVVVNDTDLSPADPDTTKPDNPPADPDTVTPDEDWPPAESDVTTPDDDTAVPDEQNDETNDEASDEESDSDEAGFDDLLPDEDIPADENPFIFTAVEPISTFGIDVDTASYTIVRRYLTYNQYLPPKEKVRIEELINYHDYTYPIPAESDPHPFSVTVEMGACPWYGEHDLLMIGLIGHMPLIRRPTNLVFLIDGSGSMLPASRLPLIKTALTKLVDTLTKDDRVGIIRFNDQPHEVLTPTLATDSNKTVIKAAINSLTASGSTNGGAAIQMAYQWVQQYYSLDSNNRVILATDGAFNTGATLTEEQLKDLIVSYRNAFIYLTVIGVGEPEQVNDTNLKTMAQYGNGNYYYIDNEKEADRVFLDKALGTIFAIAKDVKIQVEFNPAKVLKYRLIGYDRRVMENSGFNNDQVDSGELGAGHTVTAFYQIEYVEGMQPYRFAPGANDFVEVRLRYKHPEATTSTMFSVPVTASDYHETPSENFLFASAVTEWGLLLRQSYYRFNSSYDSAKERALNALGADHLGLRSEFVTLVDAAKELSQ